jgi:glycine cleavage system aminomethyltransferase T
VHLDPQMHDSYPINLASKSVLPLRVILVEPKFDLAMIAVQGPNAREKVYQAIPGTEGICGELKPFNAASLGGLFGP